MKICVCGKGGSGKSTTVVVLANALKESGRKVLILDSDESNSSLFYMLGFKEPPKPLMDLLGGKNEVQQKMMARFSKGEKERAMSIWELEKISLKDIPPEFIVHNNDYNLMVTGKIHQSMEGCACPMGVVTREFLKKLDLGTVEVAVVDLEAGLEHFGRGIEASVDMVLGVVEPSLESIDLAAKIMSLTQTAGASFQGAILNKITTQEQRSKVVDRLYNLGVPVLGTVWFQNEFQSACLEGRSLSSSNQLIEIKSIVDFLFENDC
jgi:CO dehydrogenase maturation factor